MALALKIIVFIEEQAPFFFFNKKKPFIKKLSPNVALNN